MRKPHFEQRRRKRVPSFFVALVGIGVFLAALFCVAVENAYASTNIDPGAPDTVAVDSVFAYRGSNAIVPVRMSNDECLGGAQVVLRYNPAFFSLDSFSFAGGRVYDSSGVFVTIDNVAGTVIAASLLFSAPATLPGAGLLGRMFFQVHPGTPVGSYAIDSAIIDPPGPAVNQTTFSTSQSCGGASETVFPQFRAGQIFVTDQLLSHDSVWVDNVTAAPSQSVSVEISCLNEEGLASLYIPIEYSSNDVTLDSITFGGTRGILAGITRTAEFAPSFRQALITLEYDPSSPLPAGSGPVAIAHFTVNAGASNGSVVDLTTASYLGVQDIELVIAPSAGGQTITPLFHNGLITIDFSSDADDDAGGALPTAFTLSQNYPNPFNPVTEIAFALPQATEVRIEIFNILGQSVRNLVNRRMTAGAHTVTFDARSDNGAPLSSGAYFYRLTASNFTENRKMILLK